MDREERNHRNKMELIAFYCFILGCIAGSTIEKIDIQNKIREGVFNPNQPKNTQTYTKDEMVNSLLDIPYVDLKDMSFETPEQVQEFITSYQSNQGKPSVIIK